MAATSLDTQILGLVKETSPSTAYLMGFDDYVGKLFSARCNFWGASRALR
ncbi:MAG: hypothetical protein ABR867_02070 [Nitrososphaerales archaeon]|jgi:hypothetical protein